MFIDPLWIIIAAPGLLFSIVAQIMVHTAYSKASKIRSQRGMTGADIAREILQANEIRDVTVEPTEGFLTDHYHPLQKKLRLSMSNYSGDSLAALGISAHEVGHAIQHSHGYVPLYIRSAFVPAATIGSNLGFILFLIGMLIAGGAGVSKSPFAMYMIYGGIALFAAVVAFSLITLPVEFNASARALAILRTRNIVSEQEIAPIRSVLRAAALTYVAAALTAILQLVYMIMRAKEE